MGESVQGHYTSNAQICAKLSSRDFPVDGDTSKQQWQNAEWASFNQSLDGNARYPDSTTRVAALSSQKYLYLAFSSRYSQINIFPTEDPKIERWELWERDVVEVFLNPQPGRIDHYYEFEVAPDNQWLDLEIDMSTTPPAHNADWNSGFDHATKIDPKRRLWTCEMRIPFSSIGDARPSPEAKWRINLFRAEGSGSERRLLAWSSIPGGATFHVPARFGILRFAK